jgi:hypothetical protein
MTLYDQIANVGNKNITMTQGQKIAKVAGKSILLAGFLVALGSVEMSSRFSVMNFAKNDEVLQNAANALSAFMFIGMIWSIGATAVLYASYSTFGFLCGVISNAVILGWMYFSYVAAFKKAAAANGLKEPEMFKTFI